MNRESVNSTEIRHHISSVERNVLYSSYITKYCYNIFIISDVERRCKELFREFSEKHRWTLRDIGFDQNRIHITIDARTDGPNDKVKKLK